MIERINCALPVRIAPAGYLYQPIGQDERTWIVYRFNSWLYDGEPRLEIAVCRLGHDSICVDSGAYAPEVVVELCRLCDDPEAAAAVVETELARPSPYAKEKK